ncbi:MAG: ABC transporter ATP-binding protein [Planctomycetota bacterium]|nr:ABC transporter ATP-binding protein [Planctomycetota bacterium]
MTHNSITKIFATHRASFSLGLAFLIIYLGCLNTVPWLIKHAISPHATRSSLGRFEFFLAFLAILILTALSRFASHVFILQGGRKVARDIRVAVFKGIVQSDPRQQEHPSIHSAMTSLSSDAGLSEALFGPGLLYAFQGLLWVFAAALSMALLNPFLILFVTAPWLLLAILLSHSLKKTHGAARQEQLAKDHLNHDIAHATLGRQRLKNWGLDHKVSQRFKEWNENCLKQGQIRAGHRSRAFLHVSLSLSASFLALLILGFSAIKQGSLSVGDLAAAFTVLTLLFQPMFMLAWVSVIVSQAIPSLKRLQSFINPKKAASLTELVSLKEDESHSLKLKEGEWLGLTCPDENAREICSKLTLEAPGQTIYLDREPQFFSLSIRDNLCLGIEKIGDDDIDAAIFDVGLTKFITQLQDGSETMLGPDGIQLSGGQVQRLALARALLRKPAQLILNEGLSMLDSKTCQWVLQRLRSKPNLTVLIRSQNPQILKFLDKHGVYKQRQLRVFRVLKSGLSPLLIPLKARGSRSTRASLEFVCS